ncbi:polysaccharide biosynthesis/export family protein [Thiohalocapsa halophila]|nr:polysaccharide biosynthesis/export family protein [Thiohalocapsa halophila]
MLRAVFVLFAPLLLLAGCAAVPGNDVVQMRATGESSVQVPVQTPEGEVPANVRIQSITAELIIQHERAYYPAPETTPAPPAHQDYRLGAGDIVNVIVWDHPELTMPAGEFRSAEQSGTVISEDGTMYFPFAGVIQAAGLTASELRDILTRKLSATIENVQLEVRVAAYRSQRIYVVGEVRQPGVLPITDVPMTAVEAVNRAGGFTENANRRNVTLTRAGDTRQIDLHALYKHGDTSQNLMLRDGDILSVPDRGFNKIFVLGAVNRPGSQTMGRHRVTLAEAIGDAADIQQFAANPHQIYVIRGGDRPKIFHLSSKSPDALLLADRFPLRPRDIVYVDAAAIIRWNRIISNLLPTTNILNNVEGLNFNYGTE